MDATALTRPMTTPANQTGDPLVLLAEDEPLLASTLRMVLQDSGYRVVVAENGDEALERFATLGDEVALALLDMTMPRQSGLDVMRKLHQRRPGLPVVLMSGLTEPTIPDALESERWVRFVPKPFDIDTLVEVLRQMLSQPPGD